MEAALGPAPRSDGVGRDPIAEVVARADYATFAQSLADDVVFRSPVSLFKFRGRAITSALFERLVKQSDLDLWRVEDSWRLGGGQHLVALTTTVRGHRLDLLLLTRLSERYQVREVTVYARPMASIAVFPAFVYPHLVARFRGRARAAVVRMLFRPLPRILEIVAGRGLRLGQPQETEFEAKLPTPEQSPAAPASPRSPWRRL
jgi:hypothetical protein